MFIVNTKWEDKIFVINVSVPRFTITSASVTSTDLNTTWIADLMLAEWCLTFTDFLSTWAPSRPGSTYVSGNTGWQYQNCTRLYPVISSFLHLPYPRQNTHGQVGTTKGPLRGQSWHHFNLYLACLLSAIHILLRSVVTSNVRKQNTVFWIRTFDILAAISIPKCFIKKTVSLFLRLSLRLRWIWLDLHCLVQYTSVLVAGLICNMPRWRRGVDVEVDPQHNLFRYKLRHMMLLLRV
jgi:hypothetical protein